MQSVARVIQRNEEERAVRYRAALLNLGGGERGSMQMGTSIACRDSGSFEEERVRPAKLRSGNGKAKEVTRGRSVISQQDMVQDIRLPIPWPQFISWAGSAGIF